MINLDNCRRKALILIDSELNLSEERKNNIIESVKHNRMEVDVHFDSKTFIDFLSKQYSSEDFSEEESYDLISIIAIARKFPGKYEFRKYSINDLYTHAASCRFMANKKTLFVTIMEDKFEDFNTDSILENPLQNINEFCRFEAVCPIRNGTNHFKIVLDQFLEYLSNAKREEDFVQMLENIKTDNTECTISVRNPSRKSMYLGP
ncbi:uncharacterized protein LOC143914833 [Arctopsyche grandis]|uniref:uncharacterized protein LOC143914833 n=1 Tax=Arctopsyche grandis TaxID=121162 RepID=UPI00406D70B8